MRTLSGSCHCKAVAWSLALPVKTVIKCHCGNCRKLQGADYSTWVVVDRSRFSVASGQERISQYNLGRSRKSFCSICGSAVSLVNGKHFPEDVIVPLGALDEYLDELAPKMQVYTTDKAPWVILHPDEPFAD